MSSLTKDPDRLLIIAGPCSLESEEVSTTVAEALIKLQDKFKEVQFIFKGSFDKANRTSINSERGPGLKEGLRILAQIKETYGFSTLTDFHTADQAESVAQVVDVLQVPAFLCRQTDLLVAAAQTGAIINVKKGQFLSPQEMEFVVNKLEEADAKEIWQTERGSTFGYQNLVVDMRNFALLNAYGHPTIFDATHSVQMPGAGTGTTSGKREFVPGLMRAALASGASGLFIETHPNPSKAISDGPNQIPLDKMETLIEHALAIWKPMQSLPPLSLESDL